MRTPLPVVLLLGAVSAPAPAQTGTIPGLDGRLTNNASPTYFGRRGAAHPNGEIGMSYSYTMCNPGTVPIAWSAPMNPSHPMFAFMVVRESNGRMEQITHNGTTYVKHAFGAANSASTCGGTCQSTGSGLRVSCTDTYGASTNASQFYLGPSNEIDPWTGIWLPVGSYFDRGDPEVAPPATTDNVRSLTNTQVNGFGTVKNRLTLREQDLLATGRLFHCMHIVVRGEDGDLRFDNIAHRQMTAAWNGSTWTFANSGVPFTNGTVLNQWAGAVVNSARNGEDDGHFLVASKVTGPVAGLWHYEFCVQNFDNARGGAAVRIPVCPSTAVSNVGFRDPNDNQLDDWLASRAGAELVFAAPAGNPLDWNSIYNFWFDCDAAPVTGSIAIDQARVGPGALTVNVNAQVPGGTARVLTLGPGCGVPLPVLAANGLPVIPNSGFALTITTTPNAGLFVFVSLASANLPLGNGCFQYFDSQYLAPHGFLSANGSGVATVAVPVPDVLTLEGLELHWQAAQIQSGGPVFGGLTLSNGLTVRAGCR